MSDVSKINRNYKDRLFKFIFGNPEKKELTLSLYNAMNNSSYTDPDAISLNTIEDAVYMGMKNDVSFLIADTFNLYEHQSSYNPNMPMRFLIYAGMLYDKYTETTEEYHRFSSKQQKAPTPKCVCFYNGTKEMGDRVILRLSDAFISPVEPDIEVKVTNLWINRLIGDSRPEVTEKVTWSQYPFYNPNSQMSPSGLMGPVSLIICK